MSHCDTLQDELNALIHEKAIYLKDLSDIDSEIIATTIEIGRCKSDIGRCEPAIERRETSEGGKKHRTKRYKKSRRHKRRATRRNRLQMM